MKVFQSLLLATALSIVCTVQLHAQDRHPVFSIYFKTGAFELDKPAKKVIDSLVTYLADRKEYSLKIGGHADSQGSDETNMKLSEKRARLVEKALAAKKLPADSVRIEFFGEANPTYSNETKEGMQKNRRVDITIINSKCGRIFYGPNGEMVEVKEGTVECTNCDAWTAEFRAITSNEALRANSDFTAVTTQGESLWSGGMLSVKLNFGDCPSIKVRKKCKGKIRVLLPVSTYDCRGMSIYNGSQVIPITWELTDNPITLDSTGRFYELWMDCDAVIGVAGRPNCDRPKKCIYTPCEIAFAQNILPPFDSPNVAMSAEGIIVESKTPVEVNDIVDVCKLTENNVTNLTDDNRFVLYDYVFEPIPRASTDNPFGTSTPIGSSKIYFTKPPKLDSSLFHLYKWQPSDNSFGYWKDTGSKFTSVNTDRGCEIFSFDVSETGVYAVSHEIRAFTSVDSLLLKVKRKYKFTQGLSVVTFDSANVQKVSLPLTKNGKLLVAHYPAGDRLRVISLFNRKGQQYFLNADARQLIKSKSGKVKVKKSMLVAMNDKNNPLRWESCKKIFQPFKRVCKYLQ